jgi:putative secretion ATPase (PEP-CTERM system associated)
MYESFFGFSGKPFQLNADPAFFFGSRGHRRAVAYLEYGLHQGEGFIVITGEVGAGKTMIVRSLLERLNPKRVVAANLVSTQVEAADMLRLVATAFGIACKGIDKAGILLALETFLTQLTAEGKRALLVVDEAQNLSVAALEELRMLSNFQIEDHSLLQSFLVGQPEFRQIMRGGQLQQLRQRVIASYHLGPLDAGETKAYIMHRLLRVGWKRDPQFDPAIFSQVYLYSNGIPRRINAVCDRLLLAASLAGSHAISEQDAAAVIAELREELADKSPLPGSLDIDELALERLQNGDKLLAEAARLSRDTEARRLETRIAGVEQSVSATLNVLTQLLQAVQRKPSPSPAPPPKK